MKSDMAGAAVVAATLGGGEARAPSCARGHHPAGRQPPVGVGDETGRCTPHSQREDDRVLNTDAEGRLVLADALALAAESSPDVVVDVATLTGLPGWPGEKVAGVWGNHPWLADAIVAAATTAGESVWPMPLHREYRALIDSDLADMKNTGGRFGGAITAALLLSEFVGELPWAHIDIAGPAVGPMTSTTSARAHPASGCGLGRSLRDAGRIGNGSAANPGARRTSRPGNLSIMRRRVVVSGCGGSRCSDRGDRPGSWLVYSTPGCGR